jgi:hypothetical protein
MWGHSSASVVRGELPGHTLTLSDGPCESPSSLGADFPSPPIGPVAQLTGTAGRHARWQELTEAEEAVAVRELRELADGRDDLLAEVAGVLEGASEGEPDEPRQAVRLCRTAGADPKAILAWIQTSRARRAGARRPPFCGGLHYLERPAIGMCRACRDKAQARNPMVIGLHSP